MTNERTIASPPPPPQVPAPSFTGTIHALGGLLNHAKNGDRLAFTTGDLAHLRRLSPDHRVSSVFDRTMLWLEEHGVVWSASARGRDAEERDWACILQGMAQCAGLHDVNRPAGTALAHCMIEPRFVALTQARGVQLYARVRMAAAQIAAARQLVDWTHLARLVLTDGRSEASRVRRDLARAYFHTLRHADR